MMSLGGLVLDDANLRDHLKGRSGLVAECLEEALLLPEDMQELKSFRKRKVFLSLKKDLAKVHDHFLLYLKQITINTNMH